MAKDDTRVPLKSLEPALEHISKFFPSRSAIARAMGVNVETPKNWILRSVESVSKGHADKLLKLYEVYKDQEPDPKTLKKSVYTKQQKKTGFMDGSRYPGGKLRPLEVGKRYRVKTKDGRVNDETVSGRVIQDLGRFYLVDCGNYKSTILKNDLCLKNYKIVKL